MTDTRDAESLQDDDVTWRSRGYLPHLERPNALYFVTFRLADALPQQVLRGFEEERAALLARAQRGGQALSPEERDRLDLLVSRRIQQYLDAGAGACHLAKPAVAEIVAQALRHFDGKRYRLYAWCIMPNHVHVVMQPMRPFTLQMILHSWKSFTSQQMRGLLSIPGAFWQREYYDHLIRDEQALWQIIRYVAENPAKANLPDWSWVEVAFPLESHHQD